VFTVVHAVVKFKALLLMPVCINFTDGQMFEVTVPRLGSVGDLRAAVAARTEVAASTVSLFVTGGDGGELRDNRKLVDTVCRNTGSNAPTVFALAIEACWTCTACACTNGRSFTACIDCNLPRPSTAGQVAALWAAAEAGRAAEVLALVGAAVPLDTPEPFGHQRTALFMACRDGHLPVVEVLLAAGANMELQVQNGAASLYIACEKGQLDVVHALLAAGADINARAGHACTAIYVACHQGYLDVVLALLAAGAEKDLRADDGSSVLHVASQNGHVSVVRALLAAGADKDAKKQNGCSVLFIAAQKGHLPIVVALLAAGADKDAKALDGYTAHDTASDKGHRGVMRALVRA
jgi:hypothetical protein